ncbi:MAG: hypothetical protein ASARMPRED_004201 [Alectoria sarmentosa]|nr:MAG: hypothetical protein ASARMPRED_004201 [Alectoria sarmentosa]
MASGRPQPPPATSSQQPYPLHPPQDSGFYQQSAPSSQQVQSPPAFRYAPDEYLPSSAFLQPPSHQQYAHSQAVHQQSLPSYHLTTTTPNGHPVPYQRHTERFDTASLREVGGPVLGEHLRNLNGGNSDWIPMDGLSRQNVQGSSLESYDPSFDRYGYSQAQQPRTEQSTMYQSIALPGLDPRNDFPRQYRADITGGGSEPDGMRESLRVHSATNNHEAGGDVDVQSWNRTTVGNNISSGRQCSDSQEMGNKANPYTAPGIDLSLMDESFYKTYESFCAEVDQTHAGGGDTQNVGFPRNSDDLDSYSPNGPSTPMFFGSHTVLRKTGSCAASNTAPYSRRGAGHRPDHPLSSGSSVNTCNICDDDPDCERKPAYYGTSESQKSSLRRHMRQEHSGGQNWSYQCSIDKDGSPCGEFISRADNRRRHVELTHPKESRELPPKDAKRNANDITNAKLDGWISKVPSA